MAGRRGALRLATLAGGLLLSPGLARECPEPDPGLRSWGGGGKSDLRITNWLGVSVAVYWLDPFGEEHPANIVISPASDGNIDTFVGHAFRIRTDDDAKTLVTELQVRDPAPSESVAPCGLVSPFQRGARKSEFDGLVHDQTAPCDPPGKSSLWSCVRKIPREDYSKRLRDPPPEYGFADMEESGGRQVHLQWDYGYSGTAIYSRRVPRLANTSGFLKMSFTEKLRDILAPFWNTYGIGGATDLVDIHELIVGNYTNSHVIAMSKLDLDRFRDVQLKVHAEMREYLEWWTDQQLVPTSTFGIRIYRRGSMLIDHVDIAETHLASVVIQVDQDADEDGGWPLEVIDEEGNCFEVYLQPGELVLYEGGRFRHGRPMRFKGNHFANIFSHFAPPDWHGPGKSPMYDGHLDEHGWLMSAEDEAPRPEL